MRAPLVLRLTAGGPERKAITCIVDTTLHRCDGRPAAPRPHPVRGLVGVGRGDPSSSPPSFRRRGRCGVPPGRTSTEMAINECKLSSASSVALAATATVKSRGLCGGTVQTRQGWDSGACAAHPVLHAHRTSADFCGFLHGTVYRAQSCRLRGQRTQWMLWPVATHRVLVQEKLLTVCGPQVQSSHSDSHRHQTRTYVQVVGSTATNDCKKAAVEMRP